MKGLHSKQHGHLIATTLCALVLLTFTTTYASAEEVKKSNSGICHDSHSSSYNRVKHYTAFPDLQSCLNSGGRLPKNYPAAAKAAIPAPAVIPEYDRSEFGSWLDEDHDCLNTRHEVLMSLSTSPVSLTSSQCSVGQGRWLDPYTGLTFTNARDLDIDHLVPLKWAWDHGAYSWTDDKRRQIANDPANLFAVKASVNREKGALGPLEWLPPNVEFRCQYMIRFQRIVLKYGLVLTASEKQQLLSLHNHVCGK